MRSLFLAFFCLLTVWALPAQAQEAAAPDRVEATESPAPSGESATTEEDAKAKSKVSGAIDLLKERTKSFNVDDFAPGKAKKLKVLDLKNPEYSILDMVIRFIATTIGTLAILTLVIGGYFLVTSDGDQNQITKGKNILMYTCLGLLLTFLSMTIVRYTVSLFLK